MLRKYVWLERYTYYGARGLGLLGWEKPQLFSACGGTGEEKAY